MGNTKTFDRVTWLSTLVLLVMSSIGNPRCNSQDVWSAENTIQAGEKLSVDELRKKKFIRLQDRIDDETDTVLYLAATEYESLQNADSLECLIIDGFVSNSWLRYVVGLKNLKTIDLSGTKVDCDVAKYLRRVPALHTVDLSETRFSDRGLAVLSRNKSIRELYLSGTLVTDLGVAQIPMDLQFDRLDLEETRITDQSAIKLAQLVELREIDVSETLLTFEGVRCLLGKVKRIELGYLLSRDQVDQLRSDFPDAEIIGYFH
jgi:hypothetical protein